MALTIADLMSKMPGAFIPEKAVGLDATSSSISQAQNQVNGTPQSNTGRWKFLKEFSPHPR